MSNAVLVNFSGGETAPKSRGRFDLPWYQSSARKLLNFISEIQGPARYRPGFRYIRTTRRGNVARLVPFQLSSAVAYMLEFTSAYMRVYKNGDLLSLVSTTLTAVTNASPAVITVADPSNLNNGDEVIIDSAIGMLELNNRQYVLANKSGSTFQLTDSVTGANIDSSAFGVWTSGGTVKKVYEIASPYLDGELSDIQSATDASNSVMYLAHSRYVPQKLTVDAVGNFTLGSYVRTNDPFAAATTGLTVTDIRPDYRADRRMEANGYTGTTLTPAAVTGNNITFTAGASVFTSADVGKYIWKAPHAAAGTGQGRALIISVTNATTVKADIKTDFNSVAAIPAGDWAVVTVETLVTFAAGSAINASLLYLFSGVSGATQINANSYSLVPEDSPTYSPPHAVLRTANAAVDSSAWGVYSGNGTAVVVSSQPQINVTGITLGTQTLLTFASGSVINQNVAYTFSAVGGTVQINGNTYRLSLVSNGSGGTLVYLKTVANVDVDSSAWTAYTAGGVATVGAECPIAVAFYEGRLGFFGTNQRPNSMFLSRSPDTSGNPRYDDFTGGTNADFACFFALAPVNNQVNYISWARSTPQALFVGTYGGPFRLTGGGIDTAITPSSISAKQVDAYGCETVQAAGSAWPFYIQRGGTTLRTIRAVNPYLGIFESSDLCLNAEQIPYSRLQRVIVQWGRPNMVWVVRADGALCGMTVQITEATAESITGWHRHSLGGTSAKALDAERLQRTDKNDQLWIVTERTVNGTTRRFVEYMADEVTFPDKEDFYTGAANSAADVTAFKNALYRIQEQYVHLDGAATYNGSDRGVVAGATLTPGAGYSTVGASVTFTAGAAVFKSTDVGAELWKKPNATTGAGTGRALITAYISATQVTATILVAFESYAPAGDWYFAIVKIRGAWHLNGATVAVVTDGAVYSDGLTTAYPVVQVSNGAITLSDVAAVVHVGLPYEGFLETHNLELGGKSGPAQTKPRNVTEMFIRFLNSLGTDYGTDLYKLSKIAQRPANAVTSRPAPVFSGFRKLQYSDSWSSPDAEKTVVVAQRLPLPSIVQFIDLRYNVTDED